MEGIVAGKMAPLEYQKDDGRKARTAILRALRDIEAKGERGTVRAVAGVVGLSSAGTYVHITVLREAGLVETVGRGRYSYTRLTEAGKIAAG